jgi:hypothetical protein
MPAKEIGLGAQLLVGHVLEFGAQRVDLIDERLQPSGLALVWVSEEALREILEHGCYSITPIFSRLC